MKSLPLAVALLLGAAAPLAAQRKPDSSGVTAEEFIARLGPKRGTVEIGDHLATLQVPENFRYLDEAGARRFLVEAWGNPPASVEGVLGLLLPTDVDAASAASWGVIISFDEDGYVDDEGAESINYANLLKEMQDGARAANRERERQGYSTVQLIGWAAPPRYDRAAHKLYWAKELQFSDDSARTLNYNVRVLGRRGVLVLNAVANMQALASIEQSMQAVIGFTTFNEGHRYTDFVAGTDKKAAYGIAGLIAGVAAVKVGLFKGLWLGLLAFKKLIVAGVVAGGAALRKFFGRKDAPSPNA